MTDNEILINEILCIKRRAMKQNDLINIQKVEIERLQKNIDGLNIFTTNHMKVIRLQAIKEFAHFIIDKSKNGVIYISDIPDLVKEMTEENK